MNHLLKCHDITKTDFVEAVALLENVELSVTGISLDKAPGQNESSEE